MEERGNVVEMYLFCIYEKEVMVFEMYDKLAKFITVGIWIGVSYMFMQNLFSYASNPLKLLFQNSILISLLIIPYLFSPRGFSVTDECVVIKRLVGDVKIPLEKVKEVRPLPKVTLAKLRLFGSGGLYGYFGYFYIPELGLVKMYATRLHDLVMIRCENGTYIISPKNTYSFIESCMRRTTVNGLSRFTTGCRGS